MGRPIAWRAAAAPPPDPKGASTSGKPTTAERAFFAKDIPAIKEFVPGFEVKAWHGVMAPVGTSEKIVTKLTEEIQAYLRLPATEEKLRERGVIRIGSNPRDFKTLVTDDFELYKSVIKDAGVKAE